MECPNCLRSYDGCASGGDESVVPRILSSCGHSLCHSCISQLYHEKQVQCPLCNALNTAPTVHAFTKNLALLQVMAENTDRIATNQSLNQGALLDRLDLNDQSNQRMSARQSPFDQFNSTLMHHYASNQAGQAMCSEHFKNIEAFCWTDQQALCIDCLLTLQSHKHHEVLNIEKSMDKEENNIKQLMNDITLVKERISNNQESII